MRRISFSLILIVMCAITLSAETSYLGIEQILHTDLKNGEINSSVLHLNAEWERFGESGELFIAADVMLPAGSPAHIEAEIDEAYGTLYTKFADISAGRQRIAWGVLDSLSILDIVSAEDQRNYLEPWRETDRAAVDGLRGKFYGNRWFAEAVWEPQVRLNKYNAELGIAALYPEGVPVEEIELAPSWENSGINGRVYWYLPAADVGVQAGKSRNRAPLPRVKGTDPANITIRETQRSYYHTGAWAVVPINSWILRTEWAYNKDVPVLATEGTELMREDRLHAAAGLEWNGPAGMQVLLEGEGNIDVQADDVESSREYQYMAGISKTCLQQRLEIEAGGMYSTEADGFGGEVRVEYSLLDGAAIKGGLYYLESDRELFEDVSGAALWCAVEWSM